MKPRYRLLTNYPVVEPHTIQISVDDNTDQWFQERERKANDMPAAELMTNVSGYIEAVSGVVEARREELDAMNPGNGVDVQSISFDRRQAIAGVSPALGFVGASAEQKVVESGRRTDGLAAQGEYVRLRQQFDAFYVRWHATKTLLERLLIAYKVHTTVGDMSDEARRVPRAMFGQDVLTAKMLVAPSSHPSTPVLNVNDLIGALRDSCIGAEAVMGEAFWDFNYGVRRIVRELSVAFPVLEDAA